MKRRKQSRIGVFIDAANLELSAKDRRFKVDYKKLYKWIGEFGCIEYAGFFTVRFDNKKHDKFLTLLKKIGYKLITKKLKHIRDKNKGHLRKANFDVEIAVEAIKRINSYDVFILFSGDSDFDYLLKEAKAQSKETIVVSMRYHVSRELVDRAEKYIDLRKIKTLIERKP
jgi:uncharacterized protein (TIGR00288 family)